MIIASIHAAAAAAAEADNPPFLPNSPLVHSPTLSTNPPSSAAVRTFGPVSQAVPDRTVTCPRRSELLPPFSPVTVVIVVGCSSR